jgi:hypothetical protein
VYEFQFLLATLVNNRLLMKSDEFGSPVILSVLDDVGVGVGVGLGDKMLV